MNYNIAEHGLSTQFKSGQSGNPAGRPRKCRSVVELLNTYDGTQTLEITVQLREKTGKLTRYKSSESKAGQALEDQFIEWLKSQTLAESTNRSS